VEQEGSSTTTMKVREKNLRAEIEKKKTNEDQNTRRKEDR